MQYGGGRLFPCFGGRRVRAAGKGAGAKMLMHNIRQHANASEIEIPLMWDYGRLNLLLRDNDIGPPGKVFARGARAGHYRLRGMRAHAERTGRRLVVTSQAGGGTEVARIVPERLACRGHARRRFRDAPLHRIHRLVRQ